MKHIISIAVGLACASAFGCLMLIPAAMVTTDLVQSGVIQDFRAGEAMLFGGILCLGIGPFLVASYFAGQDFTIRMFRQRYSPAKSAKIWAGDRG